MREADFEAFAFADPTPTFLLRTDGRILAANPAAEHEFGASPGADVRALAVEPGEFATFLARASGTREGTFAKVRLRSRQGERRFRLEGALLRPGDVSLPPNIIVRARVQDPWTPQFAALSLRIDEQNAEIRRRKRAEESLQVALAEKEILLGELAHRVKNNLNTIVAMFEMAIRTERDLDVRAKLREAVTRVHAMAAVQELIYQVREIGIVDAAQLVRQIGQRVATALSMPGVNLSLDLESVPISSEQATPLGLVLNELITNAYKYAYPDGVGEIAVSLRVENGHAKLAVCDAGQGYAPERVAKGTGQQIIAGLTSQLGGKVCVETGVNRGTRVSILFDPWPQAGAGSSAAA